MRANTIVVIAVAVVICATGAAAARFARSSPVAGQPVVVDSVTGLMWQGCAAGSSSDTCATGSATGVTWQAALTYCEGLTWGGHSDWRLPDRAELQSIVDYKRARPPVDIASFPATPADYFWSSSSNANSVGVAWVVDFGSGNVDYRGKDHDHHVRCVRPEP